MRSLGVVPLKEPFAAPSPLTPTVGAFQADVGRLVNLPKDVLGGAVLAASTAETREIENGICDVLDLARLTGPNPRSPQPPPGPINYPHWSEIYWLGGRDTGGENKRYLVVSNDPWNQQANTPIVVRTTSSSRRHSSDEFPEIQRGQALAVCGEATIVPAQAVNLRRRPQPSSVPLSDMVSVALGIAHVFDLHATLGISP
jgi:hypothetical protein